MPGYPADDPGAFLSTGEAARRCGLSRHTLLRAARRGDLSVAWHTPGGDLRFRAADVEAFAAGLARPLPATRVASRRGQGPLGAEASPQQLAQRFGDLLESAPDAIVTCDAAGRIVLVNSQVEALFGYRREELLGQPVELLLPEEVRERHMRHRAGYAANPHTRPMGSGLELRARTRDGRLVPVEISLSPLVDAGEQLVTAVIRDVTARRAAERQVRELAELLDQAHDAVIIREPATSAITYWNRGAERLYGWTAAEAVGRVAHDLLATIFPDAPGVVAEALARDGQWLGELTHTARDQRRVVVESRWVLRRDAEGCSEAILEINRDITARKQAEEIRGQLAAIVDGSSDAIIGMALDRTITSWNASAEWLYGYTPAEVIGRSVAMLAVPGGPDDAPLMRDALQRGEPVVNLHTLRRHRDGGSLPVSISVSPVRDASGTVVGAAGIHRDISAVQEAERRTRDLADLLDQAHDAVLLRDPATSAITYWNRGAERLYGWTAAEAAGHITHDLLYTAFPGSREAVEGALRETGEWLGELTHTARDQRRVVVESRQVLRRGADGSPEIILEINRDITARKQAEAHLEQLNQELHAQARHDALTGLPNRVLFQDRLEQALRTAERNGEPVSLLLIDLDGFKAINDTLGHEAGDELLQAVATRLRHLVRAADTVARLGGDEFAVLLAQSGEDGALRVAAKIRAALVEPIALEGRTGQVGGSIGIALYPEHGDDAGMLTRRADAAMYAAKRAGCGYLVWGEGRDGQEMAGQGLKTDLRGAIAAGGLRLHYQPIVHCPTGRVVRAEALVRWEHPRLGLLLPARFIPAAERTGALTALTVWVLEEAIRQGAEWRDLGLGVAVNLSPVALEDPQVSDLIAALLRRYGLPPERLTLEITEGSLLVQPEQVAAALAGLAGLGVRLAIDDFGSGSSSIVHLRRLPVHELKLDQAFLSDLGQERNAGLVAFLLGLGVALGVEVVAKGVEAEATWRWLGTMDCELAQGHYVSRPRPAAEFERWLRAGPWRPGVPGDADPPASLRRSAPMQR